MLKYDEIFKSPSYSFLPLAFESTGGLGSQTQVCLLPATRDINSHFYLLQHISVAIQRGSCASFGVIRATSYGFRVNFGWGSYM